MKKYVEPNYFINLLKQQMRVNPNVKCIPTFGLRSMSAEEFSAKFPGSLLQIAWQKTEQACKDLHVNCIPNSCSLNRIDLFYSGVLLSLESNQINTARVRRLLTEKYAEITKSDIEGIEQKNIMECFNADFPGDWKGPIINFEMLLSNYFTQRPIPTLCVNDSYFEWISAETKVSELLDFIIERIEDALKS